MLLVVTMVCLSLNLLNFMTQELVDGKVFVVKISKIFREFSISISADE